MIAENVFWVWVVISGIVAWSALCLLAWAIHDMYDEDLSDSIREDARDAARLLGIGIIAAPLWPLLLIYCLKFLIPVPGSFMGRIKRLYKDLYGRK